jgi:citrate synthase
MTDSDMHWSSAITLVKPNELRLRGYRLDELMGNLTFARVIFLALTGDLPSPEVGQLLEAIFVSSIDHGATPPSTLAARTAASTGAPLNAALAVGILSINEHHGGAIEACMRVITGVMAQSDEMQCDTAPIAAQLVGEYRASKKRLPGFGHRLHTDDPRTRRLFSLAAELGLSGQGTAIVHELASALEALSGRQLPINVDGAIAALLVDLNIDPALANAFFMIARIPGLVAHINEEKTQERPMRRIHPGDHGYHGHPPRDV